MATVVVPKRSRLQFADLVEVSGRVFWDLPEIPAFEPRDDDTVYQWDELDTIENVAFRFYQDTSLWWVIAKRNDLSDPTFALKKGDQIVIPSLRFLADVLFRTT